MDLRRLWTRLAAAASFDAGSMSEMCQALLSDMSGYHLDESHIFPLSIRKAVSCVRGGLEASWPFPPRRMNSC